METIEKIESARDKIDTAQGTLQIVDSTLEKAEDVAVEVVRARSRFRSFLRFLLFVAVIIGIAMAIRAIVGSQKSSSGGEPSFEPMPSEPKPDTADTEIAEDAPEVGDDDGSEDDEAETEDEPSGDVSEA